MKHFVQFALCLILGSACTTTDSKHADFAIKKGLFEETMVFQDSLRSYYMYIPESYSADKPLPLLLTFHGYTGRAKTIMEYSKYNEIADSLGFIAVYPQGTKLKGKTHWNVGGWTLESTVDDVAFVHELINQLNASYRIDSTRIYANGMSNGGYMSFLLVCQPNSPIAAMASITGAMTPQTLESCSPRNNIPVLQIHADTDGTVPYAGDRSWTIGINDILDYWVANNNSSTEVEIAAIVDINTNDGSTVEKHVYAANGTNAPVVHYFVKGGGHDWPGAWGNKDFSASQTTWAFLSQFSLSK